MELFDHFFTFKDCSLALNYFLLTLRRSFSRLFNFLRAKKALYRYMLTWFKRDWQNRFYRQTQVRTTAINY